MDAKRPIHGQDIEQWAHLVYLVAIEECRRRGVTVVTPTDASWTDRAQFANAVLTRIATPESVEKQEQ